MKFMKERAKICNTFLFKINITEEMKNINKFLLCFFTSKIG